MNFCRTYNKTMKYLCGSGYEPVRSISVITGICGLVFISIRNILHYIYNILCMLSEPLYKYIEAKLPKGMNYDNIIAYITGIVIFGFFLAIEILAVISINHIIVWIPMLIIIYITLSIVVGCVASILCDDNEGDKLFTLLVVNPIRYILDKTTSYCDLPQKPN